MEVSDATFLKSHIQEAKVRLLKKLNETYLSQNFIGEMEFVFGMIPKFSIEQQNKLVRLKESDVSDVLNRHILPRLRDGKSN